MISARYWRIQLLPQSNQELQLGLLHLLNSSDVRVDNNSNITSVIEPKEGTIDELQNSSIGIGCKWDRVSAISSKFFIHLDCLSSVSVAKIRLHVLDDKSTYPMRALVWSSDDNVTWTSQNWSIYGNIIWSETNLVDIPFKESAPALLCPANVLGKDLSGNHNTERVGTVQISNIDGHECLYIPGDANVLRVPLYIGSPALFGAEDFTIAMDFYHIGKSGFIFSYAGGLNYSWHDISVATVGASPPYTLQLALRSTSVSDDSPPDIANFVQINHQILLNKWYSLRLTRSGSLFTLKINGITVHTVSSSLPIKGVINLAGVAFGGCGYSNYGYPSGCINGYIKNILLLKGTASDTATSADYPYEEMSPILIDVSPKFTRDLRFGGDGQISGIITEAENDSKIPISRKVRLYEEKTSRIMGETWSDMITGEYKFTNLDEKLKYTVITMDYENRYNAEIQDNITPELMQ